MKTSDKRAASGQAHLRCRASLCRKAIDGNDCDLTNIKPWCHCVFHLGSDQTNQIHADVRQTNGQVLAREAKPDELQQAVEPCRAQMMGPRSGVRAFFQSKAWQKDIVRSP